MVEFKQTLPESERSSWQFRPARDCVLRLNIARMAAGLCQFLLTRISHKPAEDPSRIQ